MAKAASIDAPTLLKINSFKSYSIAAPVISGITQNNTDVLVYIDDKFAGNAVIQKTKTDTKSFYFQAFGLSEGSHKAYLIAENKNDKTKSEKSKEFSIVVNPLFAPTLVVPNEKTITSKVKPLIEGFAKSGSMVHVYIDGRYNGKTQIVEDESGTAHFSYVPFLNLNPGMHKVWAISEDLSGRKSRVSDVLEFNIEKKMPAPTLISRSADNTVITGVAKNDSRIKVFVDKKKVGEFTVKNHKSGVANFSYRINQKIPNNKHLIFVTATDKRGKESAWSNLIYVSKSNPVVAKKPIVTNPVKGSEISEEGVSETVNTSIENKNTPIEKTATDKAKVDEYLVFADLYKQDDKIRLSAEQYAELEAILKNDKNKFTVDEKEALDALLGSKDQKSDSVEIKESDKEKGTSTGGLINEKKDKQSALGWNALVFILFLAAVIAWIFWVNRELIKEKREQEEKEKDEQKLS